MAFNFTRSTVAARPIPLAILPPVFCQPLNGKLHCFGLDSDQQITVHTAIDTAGQVTQLPNVALSIGGLTRCHERLILTGQSAVDYHPVATAIDAGGHREWQHVLRSDQSLRVFPQPICSGDATLVWITDDDQFVLWMAGISERGLEPPTQISLPGAAYSFTLIPAGERFIVGSLAGPRLHFEVREVLGGQIRQQKTLLDSLSSAMPGLAVVGNRYPVVWASANGLYLRWFDSRLEPAAPAIQLASISEPSTIRSIQLFASDGGTLAISYLTSQPGELEVVSTRENAADRYEETESVEHVLLVIENDNSARSFSINPPGAALHSGGWLGSKFLLLHGTEAPYLSIIS